MQATRDESCSWLATSRDTGPQTGRGAPRRARVTAGPMGSPRAPAAPGRARGVAVAALVHLKLQSETRV